MAGDTAMNWGQNILPPLQNFKLIGENGIAQWYIVCFKRIGLCTHSLRIKNIIMPY